MEGEMDLTRFSGEQEKRKYEKISGEVSKK